MNNTKELARAKADLATLYRLKANGTIIQNYDKMVEDMIEGIKNILKEIIEEELEKQNKS